MPEKERPRKKSSREAAEVFSAETVSKLERQTSTTADSSSTGSSRRESLDTVSSSNSSRSQRSAKHTASVTTSSVSHDGAHYKQLNQYVIIKDLGRGVHAKVSLALNTANNNFYAVKATNNNAVLAETAVRKEIAVLKKLEHDNVLKLFEVVDDPDNGELSASPSSSSERNEELKLFSESMFRGSLYRSPTFSQVIMPFPAPTPNLEYVLLSNFLSAS